jgi:hypothetical protein
MINRVNPRTRRIVARLPVEAFQNRAAVGFGSVWIRGEGPMLRIRAQG